VDDNCLILEFVFKFLFYCLVFRSLKKVLGTYVFFSNVVSCYYSMTKFFQGMCFLFIILFFLFFEDIILILVYVVVFLSVFRCPF